MNSYQTYQQQISIPFQYPVHFCRDIFNKDNSLLASVIEGKDQNKIHKVIVYIDSGVADADPQVASNIEAYFQHYSQSLELAVAPIVLTGGEHAKAGWDTVKSIMSSIGNEHMCRHSFVMAVGGGSILDMVGFASSLVHRGLRLIRIPTTVLGQNDAGIGVKNGMNEHNVKNYLGTFSPPYAVLNDSTFLTTLTIQDWVGGIAEALKVAIIKDRDFFNYISDNADKLVLRDMEVMEELIHRCAIIHLDHIRLGGDPFEMGSSRPLDFGHWSAHKMEILNNYDIGHGQAVAIGIALDSYYAMSTDRLTDAELKSILDVLMACKLPVWNQHLEDLDPTGKHEILSGLDQFREHLGGELTLAMPNTIGNACEINSIDDEIVLDAISYLKKYETKQ